MDELKCLDVFSSPDTPSRTCFLINRIKFHKSAIEWYSMLLRVQPTADSPNASPSENL